MCLVMELIPLPESLSLHKLRVSPVLPKTNADLNIQYGRTIHTSSTFLLSFALVSNTWIPICSANFTASSFTTTFFSGLSSLLPTWEKQYKIKLQSCKPTKYHRYYKPGLQTANLIANFFFRSPWWPKQLQLGVLSASSALLSLFLLSLHCSY